MSDEDQVSSKWLKVLLYKSCTMEMKKVLMLEYGNLDVCFRGGVTFAWMLCNKFFWVEPGHHCGIGQLLQALLEQRVTLLPG
jgi:hypothetical protein